MREIKFRAYAKHSKSMFMIDDKDFFINNNGLYERETNDDSGDYYNNVTDIYTLMQYTGLKDKNGIEIYEGDILYNPHDRDGKHLVVWHGLDACFQLGGEAMLKKFQVHEFWEVIGNIHENPELLGA